jgi:predicted DNA binding CopG/RHH family protein
MKKQKRKVPRLKTDRAAEKFLEKDLSDLDFSQFKPVRFEFERKDAQLNMRLPASMMRALKEALKLAGCPISVLFAKHWNTPLMSVEMTVRKKGRIGSSFDDFLKVEGI